LAEPPHGRVDRDQDADAVDGDAGGGEQDWEQSPGQAEVEVVDQAGLAGRGQRWFGEGGAGEDLPVGQRTVMVVVGVVVLGCFQVGVAAGFADKGRG
jgi:hypothetical protein